MSNSVNLQPRLSTFVMCTAKKQRIVRGFSSGTHALRKEGNVLFNDTLNTFYLRSYGVRHMVKDHSDSERGNPLPPLGLLFPINSKGCFICTIPQTGDSTYHSLCYTSRGALAGTRNSSMGPPHEGSIRRPIAPRANTLTTELHPAPTPCFKCSRTSLDDDKRSGRPSTSSAPGNVETVRRLVH